MTGAEALRLPPCRWNPDEPPSSLKDESGVPALKEARPIAELLAVLSRTFMRHNASGVSMRCLMVTAYAS